jgi:predicted nuclease of predicted toxin-antitoxin system
MKFKLDENIGQRGINQRKQAGYDVSTVLEQGLTSASDPTVIKVCQQEDRCLVTLDLDFSNPLQYVPSQYKGIAVLRLPPRATIDDLTDAIQTLISGLENEDIIGKLWIIQRGRIRIYQQNDD